MRSRAVRLLECGGTVTVRGEGWSACIPNSKDAYRNMEGSNRLSWYYLLIMYGLSFFILCI